MANSGPTSNKSSVGATEVGRAINDTTAIVTGAASGIGRATALTLGSRGANVVVTDVDGSGLDATRAAIEALGGAVLSIESDVSSKAEVDGLVRGALARFGRLDAMVANAGVPSAQPFAEVTEENFDLVFGVNVKGVVFCGQAAASVMIDQGSGGKIVNVASVAGVVPAPGISIYSASKAAVRMLTRSMALELGPSGIRVNAVAPGVIRSGMNPLSNHKRNRELETAIPLRYIGTPENVAGVIAFLLSPDADYVSGETVFVDGGWIFNNDPPRNVGSSQ
jgi:NAD(P)-dependent dehydrogenase (short-subunit alcohol dehydrogenase family)